MKYDLNFKLDCFLKHKEGRRDFIPSGICRRTFLRHVYAWVKAYDHECHLDSQNVSRDDISYYANKIAINAINSL